MQIKGLKLNQKIILLILAGAMLVSLVGCSKKKEKVVANIVPSTSICCTLDAVSNYTKVDEVLENSVYVSDNEKEGKTLDELLEEYNVARINEYARTCNECLYKIGRMILQSSLAEQLCLNYDNIKSFNISPRDGYVATVVYTEIVSESIPGGLTKEVKKDVVVEFILAGEAYDLAVNINRARVGGWKLDSINGEPTIDDVYLAFQRFLLSTPVCEEKQPNMWEMLGEKSNGDNKPKVFVYSCSLDQEKVDAYNEYVRKLKK